MVTQLCRPVNNVELQKSGIKFDRVNFAGIIFKQFAEVFELNYTMPHSANPGNLS